MCAKHKRLGRVGLYMKLPGTYRLLSCLNLSQASFKVLNTAALIIRCSVVASCAICIRLASVRVMISAWATHLVRMHLGDGLHIYNLDLVW